MSRGFPILTVAACALASAALADDTLASADNAAFDKALADQPTAPEKYRRPKDWKPSAPYPKTLKEIARDHSAETMERAKAQMEKVNAVNRSGKYAATGLGMDRHKCPEWFVDAKLGRIVDWTPDMETRASGKIAVKDFVYDYIVPQMTEFIDKYDPDILWYDADWSTRATENGSYDITAYLYNKAEGRKEVCCNDRYGRLDPSEEAAFRRKGKESGDEESEKRTGWCYSSEFPGGTCGDLFGQRTSA